MNSKNSSLSKCVLRKVFFVPVAASLVIGCVPIPPAQAAGLKLNQKKASIYVGSTIQLKASGTKAKVKWASDNRFVATVTKKGKVTAKSAGTAIITANAGRKSASCRVTVRNVKVHLSEKELILHEGENKALSVNTTPAKSDNTKFVWKSSNESVASVTKDGVVTAVSTGVATISVEYCGQKDKCTVEVSNNAFHAIDTGLDFEIYANGEYSNWDGVSNVAQFTDGDGNYCFAYDSEKYVSIVKVKDDVVDANVVHLKKQHELFGGVTCDSEGYYYLVTGETNNTDDTTKETVFISKYDEDGKLIKTVGDNGSSNYDSSFCTKIPFDGGNCEIAVNGKTLAVHYARKMYSGHQSGSVFAINTEKMEKVETGSVYQSHSFAQRTTPYKDGFVFAGEGDCFNRAFTVTLANISEIGNKTNDIFHFWVKKNTYDNWDMFTLNNNFAHMGGLAVVGNTNVALTGTSVKAMNSDAKNQTEQLFIQIFNPSEDLSTETAYVTKGVRSGLSGPNGDEAATDYGVKWLSNFGKNITVSHPQVVSDGNDTLVILYEKYKDNSYKGAYYMVLDKNGEVKKGETRLSANAYLTPCRMPVCSNGKIYWTANRRKSSKVYVFSVDLSK